MTGWKKQKSKKDSRSVRPPTNVRCLNGRKGFKGNGYKNSSGVPLGTARSCLDGECRKCTFLCLRLIVWTQFYDCF